MHTLKISYRAGKHYVFALSAFHANFILQIVTEQITPYELLNFHNAHHSFTHIVYAVCVLVNVSPEHVLIKTKANI